MNKNKNKTNGIDVEALLAKRETIQSSAIKAALAKLEAQKAEEQEARILNYLADIQDTTKYAVEALRNARKQEKACKVYLEAVASAEQQFYKDADYQKYSDAVGIARSIWYRQ